MSIMLGCLNCSYSPYDTNTNFSSVESFTEKKNQLIQGMNHVRKMV